MTQVSDAQPKEETLIPAGQLAPWNTGDLPEPPRAGWRLWVALIGPGVVLAGTSIGTGEWLFGPAVSAQYGASLFWLALTSIIFQAFANIMFMRYALYCGEPMNVGILRLWPGPAFWMLGFLVLEVGAILPYNASNAAIPLTAAFLGRLPSQEDAETVKWLGVTIFLLSFVPLVFGGTVYKMLEKIMTFKLVVVLGYLTVIAVTMVSAPVVWDVCSGFFRFGTLPLRPEVMIVGRHFNVQLEEGGTTYKVVGSWEQDQASQNWDRNKVTGDLFETRGDKKIKHGLRDRELSAESIAVREQVIDMSQQFPGTNKFLFEAQQKDGTLHVEGDVVDRHYWKATRVLVRTGDTENEYASLEAIPQPQQGVVENYLQHEGLAYVNAVSYAQENGKLPPLDWAMVVSFIAIAGAGGLTNMMFSNYARDKGWGMGRHVGAIPSAFGGITVNLSHTGRVFLWDAANREKWWGWIRHIARDQAIWIFASIIGMALPCMMSLEFIRNASVSGDRVSAMSAEGIANRFPSMSGMFWFMTLFCGFLVLAPGQVSVGDQVARRWTDMIWNASAGVRRLKINVKHVYYTILVAYGIGGLIILFTLKPVQTAKIAGILSNVALGAVTLLSLAVTRKLMPRELQPHWLYQIGVVLCGLFFISISVAVFLL
jgi:hypothetical protein